MKNEGCGELSYFVSNDDLGPKPWTPRPPAFLIGLRHVVSLQIFLSESACGSEQVNRDPSR
jgi:hypothetical protein